MSNPILVDWPIDDEVWFTDDPHIIHYFTVGQCNALAWEIHKLTGWEIGLLSDDVISQPDYYGHLFIIDPTGLIIDIRGRMHMKNFRKFWPTLPYVHVFASTEAYELEMLLWENDIHYTSDPLAKEWARYIVDTLNQ